MTPKQTGTVVGSAILLIALVFVGGYATGRYVAPDKVVTTEKIVTVQQDHLVTQVDTDKIINAIGALAVQKDVHTVRIIEKEKDGTIKTTVTQDDKSKSEATTQVQDKEKAQTVKVVDHLVYQDREVTKTVERNRPAWAVDVTPGFDVAGALGAGSAFSMIPTVPHLVLGASVAHRLIGPISTGIWANSAGMGGVVLRLEF